MLLVNISLNCHLLKYGVKYWVGGKAFHHLVLIHAVTYVLLDKGSQISLQHYTDTVASY